ncbi:unnamed protein product [Symbiodinium natans]|uniref:LAGLIDADG endonuclease n=1 Tax=Symbiodinium natans TaxID=878477 RepID=A0A812IC02_9DINO|nr:unnamed protein product [Symbiodinium natans]
MRCADTKTRSLPIWFPASVGPDKARDTGSTGMAGKSLQTLQRRIDVLKSFQSRLVWPALTHFQAFGETFALPCRITSVGSAHVPVQLLRYLAGFFDGDGCVRGHRTSVELSVGQSSSNAAILVLFLKTFGGAVYVHSKGRGIRRPALRWSITGKAAQQAAARLAEETVVKRRQLELVTCWPVKMQDRIPAMMKLVALKSQQDAPRHTCSWAYVAGFFDAEGCIYLSPHQSITLYLAQKSRFVLIWIANFCWADLGVDLFWGLQAHNITNLRISARYGATLILRRLLDNGMLVKRPSAMLALGLDDANFHDTRHRLAQLVGNQARYQRLTAAGCERARGIHTKQGLLRRRKVSSQADEVARLSEQLRIMKLRHQHLNSVSVYRALRSDIRALMAQGAALDKTRSRFNHGEVASALHVSSTGKLPNTLLLE